MAEGDEFIDISILGQRTSISLTDIIHIRSTGGIDSKMTVSDFLKLISTDNIQELTLDAGVIIEQILLKDNILTASLINTGFGDNDVYPVNQHTSSSGSSATQNLPSLLVKQSGFHAHTQSSITTGVKLPAGGTYIWTCIVNSSGVTFITNGTDSGGTQIVVQSAGNTSVITYFRIT